MTDNAEKDITERSTIMGLHLEIPAKDMQAGDTYTDRSGTNWVVRNVGTPDEIGLTVRLAAGRSQAAFPEVFDPEETVKVYRA